MCIRDSYVSNEAALRAEAIALIEGRSKEYYDRLMAWNLQYGDGLESTVKLGWDKAFSARDRYNVKQLGVLGVLNQLAYKIAEFESAAQGAATALGGAISQAKDLAKEMISVSEAAAASAAIGLQYAQRKGFPKEGIINPNTGLRHHSGTDSVAGDSRFKDLYEAITSQRLQADEVPVILQRGEAVISRQDKGRFADAFDAVLRHSTATPLLRLPQSVNSVPQPAGSVFSQPSISLSFNVQGSLDQSVVPVIQRVVTQALQDPKTLEANAQYTVGRLVKNSGNRGITRNAKFGLL